MKLTRLERRFFLIVVAIVLKWSVLLWAIVSSWLTFRIFAAIFLSFYLYCTSFGCCENGYIPLYHYFFRYRFKHSYAEREELNRQFYSVDYVRIGEGVFTEEYLVFANFGVVLQYSEIEKINFSERKYLYVVTIFLKNEKKYSFNIRQSEFTGNPSLLDKALLKFEHSKLKDS